MEQNQGLAEIESQFNFRMSKLKAIGELLLLCEEPPTKDNVNSTGSMIMNWSKELQELFYQCLDHKITK
ncbi:MAG: hypothetical protein A2086_01665 [Spirochaetes bacterium GWD1_27_9]|nr:MAG: hypothetical protein A2Z98_04065 [Spirochaetes bacterium GWB1_27_13]OHD20623.1 MAG: hypothetical protein A2Y34_17545 [Spirochaetes bacterium GWC1_27_15]OHD41810.1 MAG: hypothetical protein A2086_01665 [Spirochaetes bacterium GWD1_27_9]